MIKSSKECAGREDQTRGRLHAKRTRFRSSYRQITKEGRYQWQMLNVKNVVREFNQAWGFSTFKWEQPRFNMTKTRVNVWRGRLLPNLVPMLEKKTKKKKTMRMGTFSELGNAQRCRHLYNLSYSYTFHL